MADNVVHQVTDQLEKLENLSAQSPAAQVEVQSPRGFLPDASKEVDQKVTTPTACEWTELDDSFMHDSSVLTEPQSSEPAAPRIGLHVSPSGIVTISEKPSRSTENVSLYRPSPSPGLTSFDRYLAQSSTPKLAAAQTIQFSPPSLAVERILGPKQPIPAFILNVLEDWHAAHPDSEHPAAFVSRAQTTWKNFKVFNDDADEYELSVFKISLKPYKRRTLVYRIMIVHAQNGLEKLVVYGQPRPLFKGRVSKGIRGIYLLDWLEVERKGEVQACAIKLWRSDEQKITFTAQIVDSGRKCTPLSGSTSSPNINRLASPPQKEAHANKDGYEVDDSSSDPPRAHKTRRKLFAANSKPSEYSKEDESTLDSPPSRLAAASSVPNVPSALGSPWQPYEQRRRSGIFEHYHMQYDPTPIRYRLVCDTSAQVRIFQTNDANVLFRKAREFYNGTDEPIWLLCTVPGFEEVRYLGEGCPDEFGILQEDIRKASQGNDEDRIVEVKAFRGF